MLTAQRRFNGVLRVAEEANRLLALRIAKDLAAQGMKEASRQQFVHRAAFLIRWASWSSGCGHNAPSSNLLVTYWEMRGSRIRRKLRTYFA